MAGTLRTLLILGTGFPRRSWYADGGPPSPRPLKAPVSPALHRGAFVFRCSQQIRRLGDARLN
jgi:hypothetical protein